MGKFFVFAVWQSCKLAKAWLSTEIDKVDKKSIIRGEDKKSMVSLMELKI